MAPRRPKRRQSAARRKPARKKAARRTSARAGATSLDALARKFVRATQKPEAFVVADLYAPDCVSIEAAGNTDRGHAGIEEKGKRWAAMQKSSQWKARNIFTGKNVICIEWEAQVTLNDGRVVTLPEVAVHEIKNGKIARERFYYNPMALAPSAS
jgi:ketosteroid isomerase-like protein